MYFTATFDKATHFDKSMSGWYVVRIDEGQLRGLSKNTNRALDFDFTDKERDKFIKDFAKQGIIMKPCLNNLDKKREKEAEKKKKKGAKRKK